MVRWEWSGGSGLVVAIPSVAAHGLLAGMFLLGAVAAVTIAAATWVSHRNR